MSDTNPLGTPEELQALTTEDPSPEVTVAANLSTEPKNKGGRPKKFRVDWYMRREEIWDKMNAAIDSGAPAPAVIRALQSQLDTCNQAIANEADERRERQRGKELQETVPAAPAPVPPAPDAKSVDPESERRLTNLVKRMEELSEEPPVPEKAEVKNAAEAERDRKAKEEKTAAENLEKKAADDKRLAKIEELKQLRDGILKARNNPGVMLAGATNPMFLRDGNRALREIAAELLQLENPQPAENVPAGIDIEEIKADNARTQREYAREWEWQMSGMQTSPPSGIDLFRRD